MVGEIAGGAGVLFAGGLAIGDGSGGGGVLAGGWTTGAGGGVVTLIGSFDVMPVLDGFSEAWGGALVEGAGDIASNGTLCFGADSLPGELAELSVAGVT